MKKIKMDMEIIISRFLRIGMIFSAGIITIGMLIFLITGNSGYSENVYPVKVYDILSGVVMLKSYAIIMAGLLSLIILPVGRVALSLMLFYNERDFLYVKITAIVLAVLIFSFFMGK